MEKIKLPYFDLLLERLDRGNAALDQAFARHVHWGYWADPRRAKRTPEDFAQAAEALSQKVWKAALLKNGMSVLDAGCGFGGTLASLNENFSGMDLVGLNIDPRQIERAKRKVFAQSGNVIRFVQGDACAMPLEAGYFDAVLAVECIFHFPSREEFFAEAYRVLKPGGILALCDFVPRRWLRPVTGSRLTQKLLDPLFGKCQMNHSLQDYRRLGRDAGFVSLWEEDITRQTIPTYPFLRKFQGALIGPEVRNQMGGLVSEWLSRFRWLRYMVLAFHKLA